MHVIKEYNKTRDPKQRECLCYAPYKNLLFTVYGHAITCCFNQVTTLGNIADQSISEIWNGENLLRLRAQMKNYNLPMGCYFCKYDLERKRYNSVNAKRFDTMHFNPYYPKDMEFQLSNRCNLRCIMCNSDLSSLIRQNDGILPIKNLYGKAFLSQLEEYIPHLHETFFSGGEPFLIDIYFDIWEKFILLNKECRIRVQTNGTVLNSRVKKILEKGRFDIGVSLDSLTKNIFEKIRVNADFEQVMENIQYFHQYCSKKKTSFSINVCPMTLNYKEMPDLVNFCNTLNAKIYFCTVYYPFKYALGMLDSYTLKDIHKHLSNFSFPIENDIQEANRNAYMDLLSYIDTKYHENLTKDECTLKALKSLKESDLVSNKELLEAFNPELSGIIITYLEKIRMNENNE